MNFSQIVLPAGDGLDGSIRSETSMNFSQIVRSGDGLDVSMRSEKSMNFLQKKSVSFRGRDSIIKHKQSLSNSGVSVAESSMDFETLLSGGITDVLPSLSETANLTIDRMEKSVGGDLGFHFEDSNSSLPPQCSAVANSKMADFNMDLMGKSVGDIDFSYDESNSSLPHQYSAMADVDTMKETQPQDRDRSKPRLSGHPTNDIVVEGERELSIDPDTVSAEQSFQQQEKRSERKEKRSERIRNLIRRNKGKNDERSQPDNFADADNTSLNGHDNFGHQMKANVPLTDDTKQSENMNENAPKYCKSNPTLQYTIPTIIAASVMKEKAEDRVGMTFTDMRQKIVLTGMTPNSPFRNTNLAMGDELLVINGHRIRNAKKAAEFIKMSHGKLNVTAFKGKRPRESKLEMMRLSGSDCKDIHLSANNGMVHIIRADGRFSKSGKIKTGDICLSINGIPVDDAERASELLREGTQVDHRPLPYDQRSTSDYDTSQNQLTVPGGLVIMLVFSLAKLRCRLIKEISSNLPLTWNSHFNECAIKLPSGSSQRMLHIHNDGNCEDILEWPEDIDPKMLKDIETFALTFYSQFQDSMRELHVAMQHAIT
mmetsp:Transcript_779/g.1648  ORF Transcript_779/g.1648 Transcript_779/m.1648 type:complete len:598 (-) Transcript_779:41-1834(-)